MTLKRAYNSAGAMTDITRVKRRSGNSWVDVQAIKRRSGSSWVTVWKAYTPMSLPVTTNDGTCTIMSGYNTCSALGTFECNPSHGIPPYSYAWHLTYNPNGASYSGESTKKFLVSFDGLAGHSETVKAYCTVTDSTGTSKNSATETVILSHVGSN